MAKMKRSALKQIIKECLIEILAEGLSESSATLTESIRESPRQEMGLGRRAQPVINKMQRRTAALDTPIVPNENFDDNVKHAVEALSADPLMQEILSDTARGSLQRASQVDQSLGSTQLSEGGQHHNPTAGPQIPGDPAAIFEQIAPGSSSKWAELAFAGPVQPGVVPAK
jgi:hypothetical protein